MIFRPIRPVRVLGVRVQGLIGKRQGDLARSIGRVVGGHLVEHKDVLAAFAKIDLRELLDGAFAEGMATRIAEFRKMPMIGAFLTEERVGKLRAGLVDGVLAHREQLIATVERGLEQGLDIAALVETKVAAFPVERLEGMILEVAARELRAIEILGGALGLLIGLGQVLVVGLLA
jgi:uncharacterized membrane protein YheB (UPF0754 family)